MRFLLSVLFRAKSSGGIYHCFSIIIWDFNKNQTDLDIKICADIYEWLNELQVQCADRIEVVSHSLTQLN